MAASCLNLLIEQVAVIPYVGQASEHNALCAALSFGFFSFFTILSMCGSNSVFALLLLGLAHFSVSAL